MRRLRRTKIPTDRGSAFRVSEPGRPIGQPFYRIGVNRRRAHQQTERPRITLVKRQRGAKRIGHHRACFPCDQAGGGNIPFEAPAQGRHQIGLVCCDHRHAQRNRIGLVHDHQIVVFARERINRHARTAKNRALAGRKNFAIAPGALPRHGFPFFAARWGVKQADKRPAGTDQCDRNAPAGASADKITRSVDRINQPTQIMAESLRMIGGFFRQPPRRWQECRKLLFQKLVDRDIGGAHRVSGAFFPAFHIMSGTWPIGQCQRRSGADYLFQAGVIDHVCVFCCFALRRSTFQARHDV